MVWYSFFLVTVDVDKIDTRNSRYFIVRNFRGKKIPRLPKTANFFFIFAVGQVW